MSITNSLVHTVFNFKNAPLVIVASKHNVTTSQNTSTHTYLS